MVRFLRHFQSYFLRNRLTKLASILYLPIKIIKTRTLTLYILDLNADILCEQVQREIVDLKLIDGA